MNIIKEPLLSNKYYYCYYEDAILDNGVSEEWIETEVAQKSFEFEIPRQYPRETIDFKVEVKDEFGNQTEKIVKLNELTE